MSWKYCQVAKEFLDSFHEYGHEIDDCCSFDVCYEELPEDYNQTDYDVCADDFCPQCACKVFDDLDAHEWSEYGRTPRYSSYYQERDSVPFCEICGMMLSCSLTEYAIETELEHFESHGVCTYDLATIASMMDDWRCFRKLTDEKFTWLIDEATNRLRVSARQEMEMRIRRSRQVVADGLDWFRNLLAPMLDEVEYEYE